MRLAFALSAANSRSTRCTNCTQIDPSLTAEAVQVVTGLAIWKPVQLGALVSLFGGYPIARNIHLTTMFVIVA